MHATLEVRDPQQPAETGSLRICIDKAVTHLPWRPVWKFEQAVQRTVAWYRRFYGDNGSAFDACRNDLQTYAGDALQIAASS
ncbi:MAG: hypothetical protein QM775_02550 [Pirellulales bacterium]